MREVRERLTKLGAIESHKIFDITWTFEDEAFVAKAGIA